MGSNPSPGKNVCPSLFLLVRPVLLFICLLNDAEYVFGLVCGVFNSAVVHSNGRMSGE
jgi:hypothetical protein